MNDLENNKVIHLRVDDTPYTYPRDAINVLKVVRRVAIAVACLSFTAIVLDFMFGRELSTWAINYAGDFIRISPRLIE